MKKQGNTGVRQYRASKLRYQCLRSFSDSHWYCPDATVCGNSLLWEGVEGKLERREMCTTQSDLNFALTQVPSWDCLATHVLLRKEV